MMRRLRTRGASAFTAALMMFAACEEPQNPTQTNDRPVAANVLSTAAEYRYVVRMSDASRLSAALEAVRQQRGLVRHTYTRGFHGFNAELTPEAAEALRRQPGVAFVQPDIGVFAHTVPLTLDRIDTRNRVLDGSFTKYFDGTGVRIYVLGSGVEAGHQEFGGRVVGAWTFNASYPATYDHSGHETATASIAAGSTVGAAPNATIMSVRFDGPGGPPVGEAWLGDMIAAVDWVAGNHQAPAVAVMSWGVPHWADNALPGSLEDAVKAAISSGIQFVVSAGNDNEDACDYVPARIAEAITVGASSHYSDTRWYYTQDKASNHGSCLDLWAPGEYVTAASHTSLTGYTPVTGTSEAAPYVAGVVAQLLDQAGILTPSTIHTVIGGSATGNVMTNLPPYSPNKLVYSMFSYATMAGPQALYLPGYYTWTAKAYGGTGSYTYTWERSNGGGPYFFLGNGPSYTGYMAEGECDNFALRVTINTGVEIIVRTRVVNARIELCPI